MRREASVVGTLEWSGFPKSSSVRSMPCNNMESRIAVSLAGGDELARKEPYEWSRRRRLLKKTPSEGLPG